jgi:hypothetical protein
VKKKEGEILKEEKEKEEREDMELTEKERLMLVQKKEEILKLTKEILDIMKDPKQALEIKKKMTSILSLISTIACYTESKNYNLNPLEHAATLIFLQMDKSEEDWTLCSLFIEYFCNIVNSIQFNFIKRGIKITIPKIDISIIRTH